MLSYAWLPPLVLQSQYVCGDAQSSWNAYEDALYGIFLKDFIQTRLCFNDKKINIRKHPITDGREEAFYHIICQDYHGNHDRLPDLRRCERIRWPRAIIEYVDAFSEMLEDDILVWKKTFKNNDRIHFLLEKERYLVVLEERESYCLLITAFYIQEDHTLRKKLKEYHDCQ